MSRIEGKQAECFTPAAHWHVSRPSMLLLQQVMQLREEHLSRPPWLVRPCLLDRLPPWLCHGLAQRLLYTMFPCDEWMICFLSQKSHSRKTTVYTETSSRPSSANHAHKRVPISTWYVRSRPSALKRKTTPAFRIFCVTNFSCRAIDITIRRHCQGDPTAARSWSPRSPSRHTSKLRKELEVSKSARVATTPRAPDSATGLRRTGGTGAAVAASENNSKP